MSFSITYFFLTNHLSSLCKVINFLKVPNAKWPVPLTGHVVYKPGGSRRSSVLGVPHAPPADYSPEKPLPVQANDSMDARDVVSKTLGDPPGLHQEHDHGNSHREPARPHPVPDGV